VTPRSGNNFYKPLYWQGVWTVKNLFESKIGQRVLIEGNNFTNNWADAQDGFAIVLKSTNQDNTAPRSLISDVTFRGNIVQNPPGGMNIGVLRGTNCTASRFVIEDNVFEDIGGSTNGRLFQLLGYNALFEDVLIEQNTALHKASSGGATIMFDGQPTEPSSSRRYRLAWRIWHLRERCGRRGEGVGQLRARRDRHRQYPSRSPS